MYRSNQYKKAAFSSPTICRVANKLIVVRGIMELLSWFLKGRWWFLRCCKCLLSNLGHAGASVSGLADISRSECGTQPWRCLHCEILLMLNPCGWSTTCWSSHQPGAKHDVAVLAQHCHAAVLPIQAAHLCGPLWSLQGSPGWMNQL